MKIFVDLARAARWPHLPILLLLSGLLTTVVAWQTVRAQMQATDLLRFERLAEGIRATITQRVDDHVRALHGMSGLFAATGEVRREEWRRYVRALDLSAYPGAFGFGFIRYLSREHLPAFLEQTRADGAPDFRLHTEGDAPDLFVIEYIEPLPRNYPARGLDVGSEKHRREAATAAAASGEAVLTRRIPLVQDEKNLAGFLLLYPIYRGPVAAGDRLRSLHGWAYAPVRIDELLAGIAENAPRSVDFRLLETENDVPPVLLFGPKEDFSTAEAAFYRRIPLRMAGRQWTLEVISAPGFRSTDARLLPWLVLVAGFLISVLVAALLRSAMRTRAHAEMLAREMTHSLQESEQAAQRALVALEQQKYALDQHAIVSVSDASGCITYANDRLCAVSKYSREELLGKNHRILRSGLHRPEFFAEMYREINAGRVWRGEMCNRDREGRLYWVRSTIVPLVGEDGRPQQFIAIRTDISPLKAVEAQLEHHRDHLQEMVEAQTADLLRAKEAAEEANATKSEFIANVSHELRTPMHAILAFSEIGESKADSADTERIRSYFERIRVSAGRLMRLLDALLDLSKLEAGKLILDLGPCDLGELAREAVAEQSSQMERKQLRVHLARPEFPTIIEGDAARLLQVLRNLVSNATKFTPEGGEVSFHFAQETLPASEGAAPAIRLSVCDTGVGIPAGELESIFQQFVQSSKTRTGAGGTGLGLSISREIVRAHGGSLAAGHSPSGGACFTMLLPVAGPARALSEAPPAPAKDDFSI